MQERINLQLSSIFKMAVPVMLGTFIQFIIVFTDTAFLGRLGELALNTVGNASLIYLTFFVTIQGLSDGLQILFARRLGEENPQAISALFWTSIPVFFLLAILLIGFIYFLNNALMQWIVADHTLSLSMERFLDIRSWGYIPGFIQMGIIAFYMGVARTKIITYSMLITASFNIFLDYAWIYGEFGFPELGIRGAAFASLTAEIASLIFCVLYMLFDKYAQEILAYPKILLSSIKNTFKVSYPLLFQRFLSMSSWTFFFMMIEKMGSHSLAISQIIRTLYWLAFIPIMGFNTTTRTFVSYFMAQKKYTMVKKTISKLFVVSCIATFILIHGFWFYPEFIIRIITPDKALILHTKPILFIVSISMVFFAGTTVYFSAVSGVGDTVKSMWIETISIGMYLLGTYYLTIATEGSLLSVWCMEFVYFGVLGILSWLYFKFYKWNKITL